MRISHNHLPKRAIKARVKGVVALAIVLAITFVLCLVIDIMIFENIFAGIVMLFGLMSSCIIAWKVTADNALRFELYLLIFSWIVLLFVSYLDISGLTLGYMIPISLMGAFVVEGKRNRQLSSILTFITFAILSYFLIHSDYHKNGVSVWDLVLDSTVISVLIFIVVTHFTKIQRITYKEASAQAKEAKARLKRSSEMSRILNEQKEALLVAQRKNVKRVAHGKVVKAGIRARQEELEQFAYAASHDLKEPVRTIKSFMQVARKRLPEHLKADEKLSDYFNHVAESSDAMHAVLESLLMFSRATRVVPVPERIDVTKLWNQQLILNKLGDHAVEEATAITEAWVDKKALSSIFREIVSNCVRFAREDCQLLIKFQVKTVNDVVQIEIADNGIGIEPTYRNQVFGLFKRLHTKDAYKGAGIGLALVKRVMKLNDGLVWLEEGIDGGTKVVLQLPQGPVA